MFQVAGWTDAYVDPAFRIQERCVNAERRTLVGNWVHSFPDDAYPGPNLDWLHELVRFFDRYLKGVDNGWEREPALTWFEREWARPGAVPDGMARPMAGGRRLPRAGDGAARAGARRRCAPASASCGAAAGGATRTARSRPGRSTRSRTGRPSGTAGGLSWGAGWPPNGLARDLRPDEASGLTYTSEPLGEPLSIIGVPGGRPLPVGDDAGRDLRRPAVRGGARRRVVARRDRRPEPDPPAVRYRPVADAGGRPRRPSWSGSRCARRGYRFAAGHRIRLTILTALLAGPVAVAVPGRAARPPRLRRHPSRLVLPVLPDDAPAAGPPAFGPPPPAACARSGSSEADPPVGGSRRTCWRER